MNIRVNRDPSTEEDCRQAAPYYVGERSSGGLGGFAGSTIASSTTRGGNSTHIISSSGCPQPPHPSSFGPTASSFGPNANNVLNIGGYGAERKGSLGNAKEAGAAAYTLDEMRDKASRRGDWHEGASDGRSSVLEGKEGEAYGMPQPPHVAHAPGGRGYEGVKVTIDREVDYQGRQ
ncbi:hypothetical protein M408DRAFT_28733 [Serendipita vermifera MAFF 305830]|uniref:Uncharacterized protein n=1 Tax=Serendipita vermifera MAFF 305830 TaxID=933852 RepID=A0A0C3AT09_SERVB|nr:hypothetical protein M408DRAFT_28733 [Serendipita vermifera MAFF 305830]